MTRIPLHREYGRVGAGVTLCAMLVMGAPSQGSAQQPVLGPPQPSSPSTGAATTPYRPPALALVQPAAGASVPADRPVVVFRFAPGEPNDPIDSRSFSVSVDGENRTELFQVSATEAWGPLAPSEDGTRPISLGAHRVTGRICSTRGACTQTVDTVVVGSPAVTEESASAKRKRSIVDVILAAARKLLQP